MRTHLENPLVYALVVGLATAILFVALKAALGDLDGATPVVAVGAGIGAAFGGVVGRERSRRVGKRPERP